MLADFILCGLISYILGILTIIMIAVVAMKGKDNGENEN